jgi:hypothetical protein
MNELEKNIYLMIRQAICSECPRGMGCHDLDCIERFLFQTGKMYALTNEELNNARNKI